MNEDQIARTCIEWLALDGWRHLQTDPTSNARHGKGFGEKGMADDLFIRYRPHPHGLNRCQGCGESLSDHHCLNPDCSTMNVKREAWAESEVLWVEFKGPKGSVKPHQSDWHRAERARGALVWVAIEQFPPTIEGFQDFYRKSGLMVRSI